MADTNTETHAAVIAEMRIFKCRNLGTGELALCTAVANYFADRAEAAHMRELAAGGNAAKLREAVEKLVHFLQWEYAQDCQVSRDKIADAIDIGVAALSAPPRNCDRFADETDAQIAFLNEVWLISVTKETALERDRFENWTDEMRARYAKWLLAPAEGREAQQETKGEQK